MEKFAFCIKNPTNKQIKDVYEERGYLGRNYRHFISLLCLNENINFINNENFKNIIKGFDTYELSGLLKNLFKNKIYSLEDLNNSDVLRNFLEVNEYFCFIPFEKLEKSSLFLEKYVEKNFYYVLVNYNKKKISLKEFKQLDFLLAKTQKKTQKEFYYYCLHMFALLSIPFINYINFNYNYLIFNKTLTIEMFNNENPDIFIGEVLRNFTFNILLCLKKQNLNFPKRLLVKIIGKCF